MRVVPICRSRCAAAAATARERWRKCIGRLNAQQERQPQRHRLPHAGRPSRQRTRWTSIAIANPSAAQAIKRCKSWTPASRGHPCQVVDTHKRVSRGYPQVHAQAWTTTRVRQMCLSWVVGVPSSAQAVRSWLLCFAFRLHHRALINEIQAIDPLYLKERLSVAAFKIPASIRAQYQRVAITL